MKDDLELSLPIPSLGKNLPSDVCLTILGYATLREFNTLIQYKLLSSGVANDNLIWAMQLKKYFPQVAPTTDNYAAFKKAFQSKPQLYRQLFFPLIENDTAYFKKTIKHLHVIDSEDRYCDFSERLNENDSFLKWLQQMPDKTPLNHLYQVIKSYHQSSEGALDCEQKDANGRNMLYWAVQCHQDLNTIIPLMQSNNLVYFGTTNIMHVAIKQGLLEVVSYFLTRFPAWLEHKISNKETPLAVAVRYNWEPIVEYLLSKNASVNDISTVMRLAIDKNALGIVTKLVQAGAVILAEHIKSVVINDRLEILKVLIEKAPHMVECTYDRPCDKGETPLFWAIDSRNEGLVEYLLSKNANVNVESYSQVYSSRFTHSPLHQAILRNLSFSLIFELNKRSTDKYPRVNFVEKLSQHEPTFLAQVSACELTSVSIFHRHAVFLFGPDKQLYVVKGLDRGDIKPDSTFHKITCSKTLTTGLLPDQQVFNTFTESDKKCSILLYQGVLKLYQSEHRLDLVQVHNCRGDTVLHDALDDMALFTQLMELIPIEQRLEAVNFPNKRGSSVLHFALEFSDRVLRTILPLLLPEHRLRALRTHNRFGQPFIDVAFEDLELFKWIMTLLPDEQHGNVLRCTTPSFFKPNSEESQSAHDNDELLFKMSL